MGNPFLRANRRAIRRLAKAYDVRVTDEMGEERSIPGVPLNPETIERMTRSGTAKGGRDWKQSAKRLRVLDEDIAGLSQDWVISINGVEYFTPDSESDGEGSTLLFLAPLQAFSDEGGGDGWQ